MKAELPKDIIMNEKNRCDNLSKNFNFDEWFNDNAHQTKEECNYKEDESIDSVENEKKCEDLPKYSNFDEWFYQNSNASREDFTPKIPLKFNYKENKSINLVENEKKYEEIVEKEEECKKNSIVLDNEKKCEGSPKYSNFDTWFNQNSNDTKALDYKEVESIDVNNEEEYCEDPSKYSNDGECASKKTKCNDKVDESIDADKKKDEENLPKNEISLKIRIEKNDKNKTIYFLDNTNSTYSENDEKIEHKHDNLMEINESNATLIIDEKEVPFKKYFNPTKSGIYSIKLIFKYKLSNCAYMFCQCSNIFDIDFSKFITDDVIDMKYMFYNCSSLTSLNLSSFNTEKVKDMQYMFYNCSSLIKIDLSSFNTEKVTNMHRMFYSCSSLTSLDLESFKTKNVTDMSYMFFLCKSLKSLNLQSFNTQNVTNMCAMIGECNSLTSINLSSFNTQNVTNMSFMFGVHPLFPLFGKGCFSLTSLDLSSFNTKNVTDMEGMFWGCSNLKSLDLKSFNTQKVTNMKGMFSRCTAITSFDLSSSFKLQKDVDTTMIFDGCGKLSKEIINNFNRLKK